MAAESTVAGGLQPVAGASPPRRPRRREDWRDKHLRACVECGRVWRRRRRRTCPGCGSDRSICLTCDRAWPEDKIRPCPHPGEDVRRLVKACAGDWEWARRALAAAGGDLVRARVMVERRRPQGEGMPVDGEVLRRLIQAAGGVRVRDLSDAPGRRRRCAAAWRLSPTRTA